MTGRTATIGCLCGALLCGATGAAAQEAPQAPQAPKQFQAEPPKFKLPETKGKTLEQIERDLVD